VPTMLGEDQLWRVESSCEIHRDKTMSDDGNGLTLHQQREVKMRWIKRQEEYLRTNFAPTEFKPRYELPKVTQPLPDQKTEGG
jgi:hypothetical protein